MSTTVIICRGRAGIVAVDSTAIALRRVHDHWLETEASEGEARNDIGRS